MAEIQTLSFPQLQNSNPFHNVAWPVFTYKVLRLDARLIILGIRFQTPSFKILLVGTYWGS